MLNELDTHITLEMSGDTKKYLVSAKQGDKSTRRIVAKLLNEGIPYEITDDAIVVINMEKPDGKHIYNACTYSGSEVIVELTNQALAVTGTASCDIEIRTSDNSQVLSTVTFEIEIEKSKRNENAIVSSNEYTELERRTGEHIKAIDDEHEKIKAAESKRVQAESARATAETARAGSESKREQAENARATAETVRQQNETTRNQQEQKRQKDTTEAVKAANSATQAATYAKNSCNNATERAESALQNQTQLTETLNTAIQIQTDVSQKQSSVETARKEVAQNAAKIDELVKGVTPETIGAVAKKGDTAENVVSYTSNDVANPDSYTDVDLLKSGETHKSVLQKISTMFKNIRYLYKMLGTADISALGDGTILGALCTLNSNIGEKQNTLDSPLFYRGTIKGDMNSYNTRSYNGYYYIATTTPPNAPASSGWSIVLVLFAYNDFGIQAIIKPSNNTFLLRERSGSPAKWSAWKKLALNITTN